MSQRIINQRRRTTHIGVLKKLKIGLHLKHHESVAGPALRHRVDDVELLDGVEQAEQRSGNDIRRQHRKRDAEEDKACRHAVERRRLEWLGWQRAQPGKQEDHHEGRVDPDIYQDHRKQRGRGSEAAQSVTPTNSPDMQDAGLSCHELPSGRVAGAHQRQQHDPDRVGAGRPPQWQGDRQTEQLRTTVNAV